MELLNSLHNSCISGHVPEFVSKWRVGLVKLQSACYLYNIKFALACLFMGYLLFFNTLCADLPCCIVAIADIHDYGAFISLMDMVLELDTIFCSSPLSQSPHPPCLPPMSTPPALPAPLSLPMPAVPMPAVPPSCIPKKECGNCKSCGLCSTGHADET